MPLWLMQNLGLLLNLTRSGFRILILRDASALANAEASVSKNQFGFSIVSVKFEFYFTRN